MNAHLLQYVVVAAVVLTAAFYAGGKYLPLAWRRRLVYTLSRKDGKGRLVQWLDADGGCGSGCDTCGTCETEAEALPPVDAQGRKIIQLHVKR